MNRLQAQNAAVFVSVTMLYRAPAAQAAPRALLSEGAKRAAEYDKGMHLTEKSEFSKIGTPAAARLPRLRRGRRCLQSVCCFGFAPLMTEYAPTARDGCRRRWVHLCFRLLSVTLSVGVIFCRRRPYPRLLRRTIINLNQPKMVYFRRVFTCRLYKAGSLIASSA